MAYGWMDSGEREDEGRGVRWMAICLHQRDDLCVFKSTASHIVLGVAVVPHPATRVLGIYFNCLPLSRLSSIPCSPRAAAFTHYDLAYVACIYRYSVDVWTTSWAAATASGTRPAVALLVRSLYVSGSLAHI